MEKKYVTDVIGEEYLNWGPSDIIMIKAPTGSGKTYFCLHKLLSRAIGSGERILYFVNRKVLKSQLEKEKERFSDDLMREGRSINVDEFIHFRTYQSVEMELKNMVAQKASIAQKIYSYRNIYSIVVFDECHYFYADSNFNTNTELSYDFLTHCFNWKIQVFMSATMDKMERLIKQYRPRYNWKDEYFPSLKVRLNAQVDRRKYLSYNCTKDYSYVTPKILRSRDEISEVINNDAYKGKKWLVFVDNKDLGKDIEVELVKKRKIFSENDVVYIDAEFDIKAQKTVDHIAQINFAKEKIVITTAVMDCGVSFHDIELRNIIILADTEESFIQMLGRKRKDGKAINLFVCQLDSNYFSKRLQSVQRKLSAYHKYKKLIDGLYEVHGQNGSVEYWGPFAFYRAGYSPWFSMQTPILNSLLQSEAFTENMRGIIYFYQGIVANNKFAVRRLLDLEKFYEDMIAELAMDNFAFIKKIYEWLDFPEEEIRINIVKKKEEVEAQCIQKIAAVIANYVGRELTSDENEKMKSELLEDVKYLLKNEKTWPDSVKANILKNERPFSQDQFNRLMDFLKLPYTMAKPNRSRFMISKNEE